MNQVFHGKVEKGKLIFDSLESFKKKIISLEGKKFELVLKGSKSRCTNSLKRYYFGVVLKTIANEIGYDDINELHVSLKYKILGGKIENGLIRVPSLADMDNNETTQYVNKVIIFAARDLNIYIPDAESFEF
jgi:hypothetical protein